MCRRLVIAVMIGMLLWQTPALASLAITDRQQAATELVAGPRFFAFGTGESVLVGSNTEWDGFGLEQLDVDADGALVLERAGEVVPGAAPWHDPASTSRVCEADGGTGVRALTFDTMTEIDAGRLRPDLADLRVHRSSDGEPVPFRSEPPTETEQGAAVVDADESVCVYWGNPDADSLSDSSVRGPVVPDGGWSWSIWNDAGDGRSLDLVDWSSPTATGSVPTASVPSSVCNQCANELVGFITPAVTGTYRLYLSADDVGRLEIAPTDDPAGLTPILELEQSTAIDVFSDPVQASAPIELTAGQSYAVRARSKDLEFDDHLQIAWALEGESPSILPSEVLSDLAGQPGTLTHHRFDLVETADRTGAPDSTVRIEASQTVPDTCDECAHAIAGYVVVEESGVYRFWFSSDDEGALLLSTTGVPSAAQRVAWLTNYTEPSNWTADPSQGSVGFELDAGQVIWIQAYSRDRGGPDHLQVGWSRVDIEPAPDPELIPAALLSEAPPTEVPLPTVELGPVEGRPAVSGSFVSAPIDTTATGSNVFGRMLVDVSGATSSDDVVAIVEFSDDPTGPWSSATQLVDEAPAPSDTDGRRYLRFRGTITGSEVRLSSLGVERDLVEAASIDATTTVTVPGAGVHHVLRVRGSIGSSATAALAPSSTTGITTWLSDPETPVSDTTPFDGGTGHDIGVTVETGIGPTSATTRWVASDGGGLTVVQDLVVVVAGA